MSGQATLRWGVLSTSSIARTQVIPAMLRSGCGTPVAIASRDVGRARQTAEAFGIPEVYESYEALVDTAEIDALYIPLPNALHEDWAIRALARRLPVLCEKPLSTSAASARRMVSAFRGAGVPLMEAFMYRFHPAHAHVRTLLAEGAIGELREVRAHLSSLRTARPDEAAAILNPELGGGVLLDAGCYPVNVCRWMFGREPQRAFAVQEMDLRHGVDATTAAILEFGDGALGLVSASHRAGGLSFYTLIGTHGTIEVPRGFLPGWGDVLNEALVVRTDHRTAARSETVIAAPDQYELMLRAFSGAVLNRGPVPFAPEDAIANLAVTDAISRSARSGRAEAVEPVR